MSINKILYLEKNALVAQAYIKSLRYAGFAVDWITNGARGLSVARNNSYDLIILDALLPDKNADEIINSLRHKEDLIPKTKIIILTNYELTQQKKEYLLTICNGYFIKSDSPPELLISEINNVK